MLTEVQWDENACGMACGMVSVRGECVMLIRRPLSEGKGLDCLLRVLPDFVPRLVQEKMYVASKVGLSAICIGIRYWFYIYVHRMTETACLPGVGSR